MNQELLTMPDPQECGWIEGDGRPVLWSNTDAENQTWVVTAALDGFVVVHHSNQVATLPTIGLALMVAEHQMLVFSFTHAIANLPAGDLHTLRRLYELRQEFDQLVITYLTGVHQIEDRLNP